MLLAVAGGTVGVIAWLLLWLVGFGLIWSLLVGLLLAVGAGHAAPVARSTDRSTARRLVDEAVVGQEQGDGRAVAHCCNSLPRMAGAQLGQCLFKAVDNFAAGFAAEDVFAWF